MRLNDEFERFCTEEGAILLTPSQKRAAGLLLAAAERGTPSFFCCRGAGLSTLLGLLERFWKERRMELGREVTCAAEEAPDAEVARALKTRFDAVVTAWGREEGFSAEWNEKLRAAVTIPS